MGESAPAITIDPMRLKDIAGVLKIEKASFTIPWSKQAFYSELLENDRAYYLVAKAGDQVLGYIGIWLVADEGHITNVAVHPDYRHRGIGRRLMLAIEELARARRVKRLTLEVRVSNTIAQNLYKQLNFVSAGIRPRYYRDNDEDAVIMWKDLTIDNEFSYPGK